MAAAISGLNNDEILQNAIRYLKSCEYQNLQMIYENYKAKHFQCTRGELNYFVKVITDLNLNPSKRWGPRRGELLVKTINDPRIRKIEARIFLTREGGLTNSGNDYGIVVEVFPFIKGETLWDYIDREGLIDKEDLLKMDEVLKFAISIAEQILSLHQHHIVHRDIRSRNILLDEEVNPHLIDHELAKSCDIKEPLTPCGTKEYAAPEIFKKSLRNNDLLKLDAFSFGITLFEMITGGNFSGETLNSFSQGSSELPIDEDDLMVEFDNPIKELVKGLLKRKPGDRMGMNEALDRLKAYQAQRAAAKIKPDEKEVRRNGSS